MLLVTRQARPSFLLMKNAGCFRKTSHPGNKVGIKQPPNYCQDQCLMGKIEDAVKVELRTVFSNLFFRWFIKYRKKGFCSHIHLFKIGSLSLCNSLRVRTLKCYVLVAQSCVALYDPMDCSLPGSSVHGIFQARIMEWVAISFSRDLPEPEIKPMSPALAGRFFTTEEPGKP